MGYSHRLLCDITYWISFHLCIRSSLKQHCIFPSSINPSLSCVTEVLSSLAPLTCPSHLVPALTRNKVHDTYLSDVDLSNVNTQQHQNSQRILPLFHLPSLHSKWFSASLICLPAICYVHWSCWSISLTSLWSISCSPCSCRHKDVPNHLILTS